MARDTLHLWAQEVGPSATDLLGSAEAPAAGMLGMFSRGGADSKAEAWSLGERATLLLHLDSTALIPHVLASQGRKLPIEVPDPPHPPPLLCGTGLRVGCSTTR